MGVAAAKRWTFSGLIALMLLELLWELVLAPLPGGRWLAVKALPLAFILPSLARGKRKARQWLALLTPWYFAEALVRALTEPGRHALVAGMAAIIAALTFAAVLQSFRAEKRGDRQARSPSTRRARS
ncbi:MAG: DUF2069 domain-containing protein [Casimicrobiaceae bacterium]